MTQTFDINAIDQRLRDAGVDMDEFYAEIDVHRTTWQRWKRGKGEPRVSVIAKIEQVLSKEPTA